MVRELASVDCAWVNACSALAAAASSDSSCSVAEVTEEPALASSAERVSSASVTTVSSLATVWRCSAHELVAVVKDATVLFEHVGVARLTMRSFSEQFLDLYLDASGEAATASVGGYQLEGLGVQLFERMDGDYFTVLGLPLLQVLDFLRRDGYLAR